jgi:DNA-binding MarR family transcriptional regulator
MDATPMDTMGREPVAAALYSAAMLVLRHLGYGGRQSSTSLSVLALLGREGPTRISALAAAVGLSQAAMTGSVGRLHEGGLVKRFSDPLDGRATLIDITPSGRERRTQAERAVRNRVIGLLDGLSVEDQVSLSGAMRVASRLIERLAQRPARDVFLRDRLPLMS